MGKLKMAMLVLYLLPTLLMVIFTPTQVEQFTGVPRFAIVVILLTYWIVLFMVFRHRPDAADSS